MTVKAPRLLLNIHTLEIYGCAQLSMLEDNSAIMRASATSFVSSYL